VQVTLDFTGPAFDSAGCDVIGHNQIPACPTTGAITVTSKVAFATELLPDLWTVFRLS
jgi:hypothetical protein